MDGAVPGVEAGHAGELGGLVMNRAVDGHDRDLLEGHDVGVEVRDVGGQPLEAIDPDVPPPGSRERLARPDRRPDVPGDDPEPEDYLTEPASRPWTKYRWRLKNTARGTNISRNAEAARRCHSDPYVPSSVVTWIVIG